MISCISTIKILPISMRAWEDWFNTFQSIQRGNVMQHSFWVPLVHPCSSCLFVWVLSYGNVLFVQIVHNGHMVSLITQWGLMITNLYLECNLLGGGGGQCPSGQTALVAGFTWLCLISSEHVHIEFLHVRAVCVIAYIPPPLRCWLCRNQWTKAVWLDLSLWV